MSTVNTTMGQQALPQEEHQTPMENTRGSPEDPAETTPEDALTNTPGNQGPPATPPEDQSTAEPQEQQHLRELPPDQNSDQIGQDTSIPSWQHLVSQYLDEDSIPSVRMSGAYRCPRALGMADLGFPESNPPDDHARNRMALGHMAEILIVRNLHSAGWETRNTVLSQYGQMTLDLEIASPEGKVLRTLFGHPDGICRHPNFTKNLWIPLECKSMSAERGWETQERGVAATYPGYITQIALYGRRMHQLNLTSHPTHGVFAMMDREGRPMPPERVTWEPQVVDDTLAKLARVITQANQQDLPDRPYPQDSTECRFCSYHDTCWGQPLKEQKRQRQPPIPTTDPKAASAALQWAQMKPQQDQVKQTLQQACDDAGRVDITAEGVVAGYFQPRDPPEIDERLLARLVPADILRRCLRMRPPQDRFWIRLPRR